MLILILVSCQSNRAKILFDVPLLIGKDIEEVRKILGEPRHKESGPFASIDTLYFDEYYKDRVHLTIFFNPQTKVISEYWLVSEKEKYHTLKEILILGNLDSLNTNYSVESGRKWFGDKHFNLKIRPK